MKKLSTILFAALFSLAGAGCGNDSLLSGLGAGVGDGSGSNNAGDDHHDEQPADCDYDEAAQHAAIAALEQNVCASCDAGTGTAQHLSAELHPGEYAGGALEVALEIASPLGIKAADGSLRVGTKFRINDYALSIADSAWQTSPDGTVARVVLLLEAGLPAGEYHVLLKVWDDEIVANDDTVPAAFAESGEPVDPNFSAADAIWVVACPETDEPGDEDHDDGDQTDPVPAEQA